MTRRLVAAGAALFIGVLAVALLFIRSSPESYDAQIMYQVTQSLVDRGNFEVHRDPFDMNIPYSFYGIGMSLLMAPPYWLAEKFSQDPALWVMAVNAIVAAATAVAIFILALTMRATTSQAIATSALTVFGTLILPYVATGFSEPTVGLAIALGLIAVQTTRPGLAGAASSLAILMRPESALLVMPILAIASWARRPGKKTVLLFTAGLLPSIVITAAYNALRYGAPWRTGYFFASFNHPLLAGLYGLLFSPGAGLFVYVPMAAVCAVGYWLAVRTAPVLVVTALALFIARVAFFAVWFGWQAYWAWGPRYLMPLMPIFAVGLLEILRRWSFMSLAWKPLIVASLSVSVAVQVVGAAVGYEHAAMFQALLKAHPERPGRAFVYDEANPTTEALWDRIEFDWSLWPIPDEAQDLLKGQDLAGALFRGGRK